MAEKTQEFAIEGMSCEHCVRAVTDALQALNGVSKAAVSLAQKSASVTYDESRIGEQDILAAIEEEGYSARAQS